MDSSAPLIFITLFLVACLSLFLVYKYGIKEKSYEEALAEQRQQTNALLGLKPKPKEKKNKKASKKLKEKVNPQGNETDESEHVDNVSVETAPPTKLRVEFKEEPEEVPIREVVQIKKDDIYKLEVVKEKEKNVKEKKQVTAVAPQPKNNRKTAKQQPPAKNNVVEVKPVVVEKKVEEKIVETVTVLPQTNGIVGNPGKEKKKKKSEFNTRQQLTERDGLINSVRKAELSKTEVQLLIDLLLNKQLEAPAVISDWSEGKSDPVQKLKKQLAEKEKALAEEQQALLGVQTKLKEIRAEQQAEKSQLQQKIRGLEEVLQGKHIELQASNNRIQVNTQKLQQLQAELNAEILKTHKFKEENAALQVQAQQFEVRLSQVQETDSIIAKLRGDVDELSAQNQQLRMELQQSLAEKDHQQQHFLIQMSNLEKGLKQQIQQLEESHQELERNLEIALRQENDWKIEISNLNTALQQQFEEKQRLEHTAEQLREELLVANNDNMETAHIIAQLKSEIEQLNEQQISQVNETSEESKAHEVEILNLTNELSSVRSELSSVKSEAQQIEKRYKAELESSNSKCSKIQSELDEQKAKNNELRTKNWKVMEALNAAESRSKASIAKKQPDVDLDKLTREIRTKEQDSQKQFIQRLFPEIRGLQAVSSEDWQAEFGKLIRNYVDSIKKRKTPSSPEKQDVSKLQAQVQHYKNIIDDTEGMLNKLQSHIEREEIKWRHQLTTKETEIENLKETHLSPLQSKISSLEQQLSQELSEKQRVLQEYQLFKGSKPQSSTPSDATATIEKLSEEVNRLREQLRVEQTKNGDVSVCLKAQSSWNNSSSVNGAPLIEVPTIRNANICSNMGCQFLYCDGKSCRGN